MIRERVQDWIHIFEQINAKNYPGFELFSF